MRVRLPKDKESRYLINGIEYTVFAMYIGKPIEVMIQVDSLPAAPYCIRLDDVEIVDNRLSKFWVFGEEMPNKNNSMNRPAILAFPEWVKDVFFYENIVESKDNSGDIWREYRSKMEREFAPSYLVKSVTILDDGWLQCVNCSNVWQSTFDGEVVSCPSCLTEQKRVLTC